MLPDTFRPVQVVEIPEPGTNIDLLTYPTPRLALPYLALPCLTVSHLFLSIRDRCCDSQCRRWALQGVVRAAAAQLAADRSTRQLVAASRVRPDRQAQSSIATLRDPCGHSREGRYVSWKPYTACDGFVLSFDCIGLWMDIVAVGYVAMLTMLGVARSR